MPAATQLLLATRAPRHAAETLCAVAMRHSLGWARLGWVGLDPLSMSLQSPQGPFGPGSLFVPELMMQGGARKIQP